MRKLSIPAPVVALLIAAITLLLFSGVVSAATLGGRSPSDNRKAAVEDRNNAFNRAQALYPAPYTTNFPMRKHGNLKMQSPSYDGVYYGQSACDQWFFFDYNTNALIVTSQKFTVADKPLKIDAAPIKVK